MTSLLALGGLDSCLGNLTGLVRLDDALDDTDSNLYGS